MALIGVFGLLQRIVDLIGPEITFAMMASVGVMLAMVAVDLVETDKKIRVVSIAVAIIVWVISASLVHTIVWSVVTACIVERLIKFELVQHNEADEALRIQPLAWKF
ncbi:MAG: hypothetical protein ACOY9Y_09090 [Bacillota bacterium]